MDYIKRKSGLIVKNDSDKKPGTQCAFCPKIIHLHQESGGMLHVKGGKPICAACRILSRSKFSTKIRADRSKFDADVVARREHLQDKANDNAMKVAAASQNNSGADSKKKKDLQKQVNNTDRP